MLIYCYKSVDDQAQQTRYMVSRAQSALYVKRMWGLSWKDVSRVSRNMMVALYVAAAVQD